MSNTSKYTTIPQNDVTHTNDDIELSTDDIELSSIHSLQSLASLDFEQDSATATTPEDTEAQVPETTEHKSDMKMAFMNMANSILGAGIIGQPYAFKNTGLATGIVALIILTFLIDWTIRLIVINARLSNKSSYQDVVEHCFGKPGKYLLLVSISAFAYGGSAAFCVIIGDTVPHVLKYFIPKSITTGILSFLFHRNTIIVIFTTCISYPLSLNKEISKLAKASGFALVGMCIIVLVVAIRAPMIPASMRGELTMSEWFFNISVFQGISVISFALVCHHNTIFIYNSLKNPTMQRFNKLTHLACGVSMIACGIMAISGFVNFKDKTKGNILNNFPSDDWMVNIARFCFGLNMLTTFPLEIFVVRDVLKEVVAENMSDKQHFWFTTFLVFSSMSISLFTCNLGALLEIIGSTSASIMAYIIPPLCYLKMQKDLGRWQKIGCWACVAFGSLVMVISSTQTIITTINSSDGGSHCSVD